MTRDGREQLARAFDRRLGQPPAGARDRVLHAVAAEATLPRPWLGFHLGGAAAIAIALVMIAVLLGARGLHPNRPAAPARPAPPAHLSPSARQGAAAAYDSAHGRLVVFGGWSDPRTQLDDTWTWDGSRWTLARPDHAPSAREAARAAYDPKLGVIIVGGTLKTGWGDDTWSWDGTTWHELSRGGGPHSDAGIALAYDPSSSSVIAYAGRPSAAGDTWRLAGGSWERLNLATSPALNVATMGWDGHRLILVGTPFGQEQGQFRTQTWAWDGGSWTRLAPAVRAPFAFDAGAYDAVNHRLVMVGSGETWTWDGSTWARAHPTQQPGYGVAVAQDGGGRVLAFGGMTHSTPTDALWKWEGSDWRLLAGSPAVDPAPAPSPGAAVRPAPVTVDPGRVAAVVAAGTTGIEPRLVPTYVPPGMTASVTASDGGLSVLYTDDTHERTITFGAVIANPPPSGEHGSYSEFTFRGQRASYVVYDAAAALSQRYVMWAEPGTSVNAPSKTGGVAYFASSSGISEAEFFQVLNSLQKV